MLNSPINQQLKIISGFAANVYDNKISKLEAEQAMQPIIDDLKTQGIPVSYTWTDKGFVLSAEVPN